MNTMVLETGIFSATLVFVMFKETYSERKEYKDCLLFSRLLLATLIVLIIDTIGWVIDGNPLFGHIWITTVVDGLDLLLTTIVCWCWVQYTSFIAGKEIATLQNFYKDFPTILLFLQMLLISTSQIFDFYYYVDSTGIYWRSDYYIIHTLISLTLLLYSSVNCILAWQKENNSEKKHELLFISLIIILPILGNIFQLYVYGYPTVWLCMVLMTLIVFIHIQNKHNNTERKKHNRDLVQALNKANAASDAKTDFLARMSHDMRTPMNGILGICNLMESETKVEELKSELPKIKQSGEYLLQLINDVLDVNKVESRNLKLNPQVCDEEEVFDSIIAMIKPQMNEKNIEFTFTKKNIEWTYMKLDVQRVKQIFINLLNNAIKFTPKDGKIDFIMELVSEDENTIVDKFIIRDNGIGVSKEFLPNIFKPFAQENRIHENLGGTGLGLTIVKSLVESMDGSIRVESQLGKGTEFTLYLNFPLAKKPLIASETIDIKTDYDYTHLEGLHILLCEDHPLNAEITIRLLKKYKANVDWQENGQLGVNAFADSPTDYYDIILMDIRMPVMDGLKAASEIRGLDRRDAKVVPILALTANAYEEDVKKTYDAGMNAHIAKPINPENMYQTIINLLRD